MTNVIGLRLLGVHGVCVCQRRKNGENYIIA